MLYNPDFKEIMGGSAGILILVAFVPYILAIVKGQTKPMRASWFIWVVVSLVFLVSYYEVGGGDAIWLPLGYLIGTVITAILSIRYGKGGWTKLDKICITGCFASLVLWFMLGSAEVALFAILAVDVAGAVPTIVSAHRVPKHENSTSWLISVSANAFNLFAVPSWDFVHAAYPVYMFVFACVVAYLSLRRNITAR